MTFEPPRECFEQARALAVTHHLGRFIHDLSLWLRHESSRELSWARNFWARLVAIAAPVITEN